MSDERARRVGHNEALFRQVNEQIEGLNAAFATQTETFAVVCECGELSCIDQIQVPVGVYERTRQNAAWFLVKPGHEAPDIEHVVDSGGDYRIVEKEPAVARRIAEETDPRG